MKVKITSGGFFYNFGARVTGEVIDVPSATGKNWIANGIAEPVRAKKGPKEATASPDALSRETR